MTTRTTCADFLSTSTFSRLEKGFFSQRTLKDNDKSLGSIFSLIYIDMYAHVFYQISLHLDLSKMCLLIEMSY